MSVEPSVEMKKKEIVLMLTSDSDKSKNVAGLVRKIRDGLVDVPADEKPIASVLPARKKTFSIENNKAELDALVHDLQYFMIIPVEPVPSPQPLLGGIKTTIKRMILRALRPFLLMVLTEQVEWNENAFESIKRMHESLEYLRQEVEFINKKIDAYRLNKENERPEP